MILHNGKTIQAFNTYEKIYPLLKHDEDFIYNYGSELSLNGHFSKSIPLLKMAICQINDADVHLYLGRSYEGVGKYNNAIKAYEKAVLLVPFKFYPKYLLVSLYFRVGEQDKAIVLAKEIINQDVKVPSAEVNDIKNNMKKFLELVEPKTKE